MTNIPAENWLFDHWVKFYNEMDIESLLACYSIDAVLKTSFGDWGQGEDFISTTFRDLFKRNSRQFVNIESMKVARLYGATIYSGNYNFLTNPMEPNQSQLAATFMIVTQVQADNGTRITNHMSCPRHIVQLPSKYP